MADLQVILSSGDITEIRLGGTTDDDKAITSGEVDTKLLNLGAVSWRGEWQQQEYYQYEMVRDGSWTMVANKTTIDRAAPQAIGEPYFFYDDSGGGTTTSSGKQVVFGHRYTWDVGGWLTGYRIHTVIGNHYEVIVVIDPLGANEARFVNSFTSTINGWREFGLVPSLIAAGTVFDLIVIAHQPETAPTLFQGLWDYKRNNTVGVPSAGEIWHTNTGLMQIPYVDKLTADHTAELQSMSVGDIIVSDSGAEWAIQAIVQEPTYISFLLAPTTRDSEAERTLTFKYEVADNLTHWYEADEWAASAEVKGLYTVDDSWENAVLNNNAYGVDLQVQAAYISPDWDLVAVSGDASERQAARQVAKTISLDSNSVTGGGSAPTWITYKGSRVMSFAANAEEQVHFQVKMPNDYLPGSDVLFHVHAIFANTTTGNRRYTFTHSWANIEETFPAETSVTTDFASVREADDNIVGTMAVLDGTGKQPESVMLCSLTRNGTDSADTETEDTILVFFDFEYIAVE